MSEEYGTTRAEESAESGAARAEETAGGAGAAQKHSGISRALNRWFHHIDRGGTLKSEVTAGILLCILAVCGMFINLQLISGMLVSGAYETATVEQLASNGEIVATMYFVSMLIAFVGSLVIGVVARLPFVQVSGLGLSSVMISLIGTSTGLSYYNLIAVCFVSSIVYAVVVALPPVKNFLFKALPQSVRKAIPAAIGLLLAFVALQLSGVITVTGSSLPIFGVGDAISSASGNVQQSGLLGFSLFGYASDRFHPTLLLSGIFCIVTVVLVLVFKARKAKHPYLWSLLISTVAYILLTVLLVNVNWTNMSLSFDSLLGRAWMIGSEDAMLNHLGTVFSNLSIGKIFTEGFNFSAYTEAGGSVALLFIAGILTMLAASLYGNEAVMRASAEKGGYAMSEKESKVALLCNAGINVIAPLFNGSPVEIGTESVAGAEDNAKSGIASVVAAIGFAVSMFVWIIPAIFVTYTSPEIQMNLYGHYGKVLQLLTECSFAFADTVMCLVGLSMVKNSLDIDWKDYKVFVPWIATIAGTFFLSNVAWGLALGVAAYTVVQMVSAPAEGVRKLESLRAVGIPTYVLTVLCILLVILAAML